MSKGLSSGLALLGGSAIGAALMYLMDPEEGDRRRHDLTGTASDVLHRAGNRLGVNWHDLASHAHELTEKLAHHATKVANSASDATGAAASEASDMGHHLADQVKQLGKVIADHAHDYTNRASAYVSSAGDSASDAADKISSAARSQGRSYRDQANRQIDDLRGRIRSQTHESHAGAYGLSAAGALALGLGALYFLDSEHGAERRSQILEHANQYLGDAGEAFRHTGAYLSQQFDSIVHEVRGHLGQGGDDMNSLSANPGGQYGAPEGATVGGQEQGGSFPTILSNLHLPTTQWSPTTRLLVGVAGGTLGFYGAVRRDWVGTGVGLLGVGMIATGLVGLDLADLRDKARDYGGVISDKAHEYGRKVSDTAQQYGGALSDKAGDLSQKAREYGSQLGDTAGQWRGGARDLVNKGIEAAKNVANQTGMSGGGSSGDPSASSEPQADEAANAGSGTGDGPASRTNDL
jgi:cell division septum initiation protein DivIVA